MNASNFSDSQFIRWATKNNEDLPFDKRTKKEKLAGFLPGRLLRIRLIRSSLKLDFGALTKNVYQEISSAQCANKSEIINKYIEFAKKWNVREARENKCKKPGDIKTNQLYLFITKSSDQKDMILEKCRSGTLTADTLNSLRSELFGLREENAVIEDGVVEIELGFLESIVDALKMENIQKPDESLRLIHMYLESKCSHGNTKNKADAVKSKIYEMMIENHAVRLTDIENYCKNNLLTNQVLKNELKGYSSELAENIFFGNKMKALQKELIFLNSSIGSKNNLNHLHVIEGHLDDLMNVHHISNDNEGDMDKDELNAQTEEIRKKITEKKEKIQVNALIWLTRSGGLTPQELNSKVQELSALYESDRNKQIECQIKIFTSILKELNEHQASNVKDQLSVVVSCMRENNIDVEIPDSLKIYNEKKQDEKLKIDIREEFQRQLSNRGNKRVYTVLSEFHAWEKTKINDDSKTVLRYEIELDLLLSYACTLNLSDNELFDVVKFYGDIKSTAFPRYNLSRNEDINKITLKIESVLKPHQERIRYLELKAKAQKAVSEKLSNITASSDTLKQAHQHIKDQIPRSADIALRYRIEFELLNEYIQTKKLEYNDALSIRDYLQTAKGWIQAQRLTSDPSINKSISEIEASIDKVNKPVHLQTQVLRMLQSVNFAVNEIEGEILSLLGNVDVNTEISSLPKDQVSAVLKHYGLSENAVDMNKMATAADLIKAVSALKKEGMRTENATKAMIELIENFIVENQNSLTAEQHKIFSAVKESISRHHDVYLKEIRKIRRAANNNPSANDQGRLDELENILAESILKNVDAGNSVGEFLCLGWAGHLVDVEVRLLNNGKYEFIVANAGQGLNHHRKNYKNRYPADRIQDKNAPYFTIQRYEVDPSAASGILKNLVHLCERMRPNDGSKKMLPRLFYNAFDVDGVICKHDHRIAARPSQKIGNCAVRNQLEAIYYVLQRNDQTDAANGFQAHITEVCKGQKNKYPALEDALVKNQKTPILPLAGTASFVVEVKKTAGGLRIQHELTEEGNYIVGRQGDIEIVDPISQISRQHAQIDKKNVVALSREKIQRARNGRNVSGRGFSLQKNDIVLDAGGNELFKVISTS